MSEQARKAVVIGQGYVGLPVATRAVQQGFSVVGIDLDDSRVGRLAAGDSYVDDVSASQLRSALNSGRYLPTTSYSDAENFDFAIITVPTPLKERGIVLPKAK